MSLVVDKNWITNKDTTEHKGPTLITYTLVFAVFHEFTHFQIGRAHPLAAIVLARPRI